MFICRFIQYKPNQANQASIPARFARGLSPSKAGELLKTADLFSKCKICSRGAVLLSLQQSHSHIDFIL